MAGPLFGLRDREAGFQMMVRRVIGRFCSLHRSALFLRFSLRTPDWYIRRNQRLGNPDKYRIGEGWGKSPSPPDSVARFGPFSAI